MCGLDSNSLVVEFSRNMGSQLENFKVRGVRVLGVDPARNRAELDFVTDTTECKQGLLLPGSHVPIMSESYGKQHPPDYFLLLAWNYATEIIRKEMEFIAGGGKFIVPIPWPAVVSAENVQGFLQQGRGGRAAVS